MELMDAPLDAVAAVVHRDPYPFYAALRDGPPLVFDQRLKLWIAGRADVIEAVLAHPACRVRPPGAPVPPAIEGSSAAEVFARLVRMNDGAAHAVPKLVLQRVLGRVNAAEVKARALRLIGVPPADPAALSAALLEWPVACVADRLGFMPADLPAVAADVRAFVACLSPLSNATELHAASRAAQSLLDRIDALLRTADARPDSLLAQIQREAQASGWSDTRSVAANLVGLMSQSCEATAGWIGNALIALRDPRTDLSNIDDFVHQIARRDPAVQNTRRFVAEPIAVMGVALAAGDVVLLVLAAAGRGFGHGAHACPGEQFAAAIVSAAVEAFMVTPRPPLQWRYRPSVNARVPEFFSEIFDEYAPIDRSSE